MPDAVKQIRILNCYFNDWLEHQGWWSQMNNPELSVGDEFEFIFDHQGPLKCRATGVLGPGEPKLGEDGQEAQSVRDWWVIQYKEVKPPGPVYAGIYRNWKGNLYRVHGISNNAETGEQLVVYQDSEGGWWSRSLESWHAPVGLIGREEPRFTLVQRINDVFRSPQNLLDSA